MAWPNVTLTTTNLDSTSDSPANARADLYDTVVAVNDIIGSRNTANGVAGLSSTGYISQNQINPILTSSGGADITLQPASERVNIVNIINLPAQTVSQLSNLTAQTGDVSYCSNGASGNVCIAVYTGSNWQRIDLGANIASS